MPQHTTDNNMTMNAALESFFASILKMAMDLDRREAQVRVEASRQDAAEAMLATEAKTAPGTKKEPMR